jgi:hypothetical protein
MNTGARRPWWAGGALFLLINVIRALQGDWAFLLWLDGVSVALIVVALLVNGHGMVSRSLSR